MKNIICLLGSALALLAGNAAFAATSFTCETSEPRASMFVAFGGAIEASALEEVPVEVEVTTPDCVALFKDEANFLFAKKIATPAFDGKDDDWAGVPAWEVDSEHATRAPQWHDGPKDVRADVRVAWNEEYLLFFVRTEDDVFLQETTGWKTWNWDSLQMGFTKVYRHKDTNNQWLDALTRCRTEIDFALTKNGPETFRAMTWDSKAFPVALLDPEKARLGITQRKDADGRTYTCYEIGLKWELLGMAKAEKGQRLGWSLAVLDQDERDRTVQLFPSMIGAFVLKNPMKFGMLTLGE